MSETERPGQVRAAMPADHGVAAEAGKTLAGLPPEAGRPEPGSLRQEVRRRARALLAEADDLLSQVDADWSPPPVDPLLVAHVLGIRCVGTTRELPAQAMVCADAHGLAILYRASGKPAQVRQALFHELAHCLFPDYSSHSAFWSAPRLRLFRPDEQLESLCDMAAAELQMPLDLFRQDLRDKGFGAYRIPELCATFQVTTEAACQRLIEADECVCALVRFEARRRGRRQRRRDPDAAPPPGGTPDLRAMYCYPTSAFRQTGLSLPSWPGLERRTCIERALRSRKVQRGEEWMDLGGRQARFRIEALPLRGRHRAVLALLQPAGA